MGSNLFLGMSLVAVATLIGSCGALFLKYVSKHVRVNLFSLLKRPLLYLALFLYGAATLIFVYALKFGELSVLYPVVALSYIWITLLSIKFLKEKMTDLKWLGIFMIIVGVVLIGFGA